MSPNSSQTRSNVDYNAGVSNKNIIFKSMAKKSKAKSAKKETSKIKLQSGSDQQSGSQPNAQVEQDECKHRHENSLAALTRRFIELIKTKPGYKIDLNDAANELGVQKRRIYDITNVMQGVGYVQKIHKNAIRFLGSTQDPNLTIQTEQNQAQIERLAQMQRQIDRETQQLLRKMKTEFLSQSQLNHVRQQDLKELVYGQCASYSGILVFQPEQGTEISSYFVSRKDKTQMNLFSQGTIRIYCIDKQQIIRYPHRFKEQQSQVQHIKNQEDIYQQNREDSDSLLREQHEGISKYIKLQNEIND